MSHHQWSRFLPTSLPTTDLLPRAGGRNPWQASTPTASASTNAADRPRTSAKPSSTAPQTTGPRRHDQRHQGEARPPRSRPRPRRTRRRRKHHCRPSTRPVASHRDAPLRVPKTVENSEWATRLLRAELGTKRLAKLTVIDVERALSNIGNGSQSPKERHRASRRVLVLLYEPTLRRVLSFSARRGLVAGTAAMAAEWAELPSDAPARVPRKALNPTQTERLWDALDDNHVDPCSDCNSSPDSAPAKPPRSAGTPSTSKPTYRHSPCAWSPTKNGRVSVLVDELKTTASRRTIALSPEAVELLARQRSHVAKMRNDAQTKPVMKRADATPTWTDHNVCFPTPTGAPWNPSNARRELAKTITAANEAARQAAEVAGTTADEFPAVTPNELRHTAASILSDRGTTPTHRRPTRPHHHSDGRRHLQTQRQGNRRSHSTSEPSPVNTEQTSPRNPRIAQPKERRKHAAKYARNPNRRLQHCQQQAPHKQNTCHRCSRPLACRRFGHG